MQDHIPDALITAFERQYDASWNDPQLRNERLAMRYGWAAAIEAKPCLHQIQEPAPATAMDALREAEAALEVAMARILKADPGHSISVTSEAKALVAVRAALAAPAAVAVPESLRAVLIDVIAQGLSGTWHCNRVWEARHVGTMSQEDFYPVDESDTPTDLADAVLAALAATPADHVADAGKMVLPEPDAWLAVYEDREGNSKFYTSTHKDLAVENDTNGKPQPLYTEQQVRALLATCGQAQELADTVQTVFDALQDKIDARGPISKGNLQYYVNRLREAFDAAPQAQADARDAELLDFIDSHAEGVIRLDAVPNYLHWGKHWEHKTARAAIAAAKGVQHG